MTDPEARIVQGLLLAVFGVVLFVALLAVVIFVILYHFS